jgi:nucleotide-binding universal stress UspA family protein
MLHLRTILHPTDMSVPSINAFHLACSLARDHGARLILLHVAEPLIPAGMSPPQEPSLHYLKQKRRELRLELPPVDGIATKYSVRVARDPVEAILAAADRWDVDLVVMGTHGRTGLAHFFMGSVAEKVLQKARCPVLTVKLPFVEKKDSPPASKAPTRKERQETEFKNETSMEAEIDMATAK